MRCSTTCERWSRSSRRRSTSWRCRRPLKPLAAMIERLLGRPARLIDSPAGPHVHWSGGGEPKVLLLGHHDTVFPLGALAARPFTVADGHVTGPGVFDMLAGIVQALHGLATLDDISGVELLFSADEEVGSLHSRQLIEERARGLRCGAGARTVGRWGSVEDRTQGLWHLRRARTRARIARRPRTGEGRQRARRGGTSGARDQRPRAIRRGHHGHADGCRRSAPPTTWSRRRVASGSTCGSSQPTRRTGSRRRWQRCVRSIPTRRSKCRVRSIVPRCPSRHRSR